MLAQQPRAKTNRGKLETSMVRQEEWKKNRTKDKLFRAARNLSTPGKKGKGRKANGKYQRKKVAGKGEQKKKEKKI